MCTFSLNCCLLLELIVDQKGRSDIPRTTGEVGAEGHTCLGKVIMLVFTHPIVCHVL